MNTTDLQEELKTASTAQNIERETPTSENSVQLSRRQKEQLQKLSLISFAVKNDYDFDKYDSLDQIYFEANNYLENNAVCP